MSTLNTIITLSMYIGLYCILVYLVWTIEDRVFQE